MRTKRKGFYILIIMVAISFLVNSCSKEDNEPMLIKDIDGNTYNTVKIGAQIWFSENLKTTRLNDETLIPLAPDNVVWGNLYIPAFCWYNNDEELNKDLHGALYNWYTINTGKLCPTGWKVPTDLDWKELINFLGGEEVAGGKLKSIGTINDGNGLWYGENIGATNEVDFNALPSGFRYHDGSFHSIGFCTKWWSSTEYCSLNSYANLLNTFESNISQKINSKKDGFSIRCIKE